MSSYPERFDSSTLSSEDQKVLGAFFTRRAILGRYIRQLKIYRFTCPACAYPTLQQQGGFELCAVCDWEDDGQDDEEADYILGGPNGNLSLTEYRVATGYMLRELEHEKQGALVTEPQQVLDILEQHEARMDAFQETHSMNVEADHPVWEAWKNEKMKLRWDLVQ